jgi:hypothetical protein
LFTVVKTQNRTAGPNQLADYHLFAAYDSTKFLFAILAFLRYWNGMLSVHILSPLYVTYNDEASLCADPRNIEFAEAFVVLRTYGNLTPRSGVGNALRVGAC